MVAQFTGWVAIDPLIALLVSALIVRMGVSLVVKSSRRLMDRHSPEVEAEIMAVIKRHRSQYVDFHDVKTRRSGNQIFAELHITVDGFMTVQESHELTEHLEEDLRTELPEATITIHVDPSKTEKLNEREMESARAGINDGLGFCEEKGVMGILSHIFPS